ncbi:FadR/GntR family transcriptional regulator [soil metagenome]
MNAGLDTNAAGNGLGRSPEARRPARRRGLHREAVDTLGKRIVSGGLPIGSTLPNEADLGDELAVSRTVVREAVKVLAAKGLVDTRPRMGTRVQPRSHWDVIDHDVLDWIVGADPTREFYRDLFEVRSIFEPHAAALAAGRRSAAEAEAITELMERMADAVDDREAYIVADLRFHEAILRAAHNELLARLSGTLGVALQAGRGVTTRVPAGPSSSMALHRELSGAIADADTGRARQAMQRLIDFATQDMEVVLSGSRLP